MASLFPAPQQYFDNNGDPLAGGKVYFYEAGTTTPKDTYTTQAGTIANANPVILDSAGRASIWGTGSYKEVVKTSADVLISTKDSVTLGGDIDAGIVTNTMLADMAANTVKCRSASTTGVPSDVSVAAGQVLGRDATGNLAGINMVTPLLSHATGVYYSPSNFAIECTSNLTLTANRMYAVPFFVPETKTYTKEAAYVTTVGGNTARLGIYRDTGGVPDTLVLDAGEITISGSTGVKELSFSQSLTSGKYWLAMAVNGGGAIISAAANTEVSALLGVSAGGGTVNTYLYRAFTYAALPATFGAVTRFSGGQAPWLALMV